MHVSMFPGRVRIDLLKYYTMSREEQLKKVFRLKDLKYPHKLRKIAYFRISDIHLLIWALWVETRTEVPKISNLFYQCKPIMCISFSVWPVRRCYTYTNNACCPYINTTLLQRERVSRPKDWFDWCYIRADSWQSFMRSPTQHLYFITSMTYWSLTR